VNGAMKTKLSRVRSGVRGMGKTGCMNICVPLAGTMELSPSSATVGIRIPAKEGAMRI